MNKQEEQDLSFTYRSQTGAHTGNEPRSHASEVCEPEEQTLTSPGQCTRHKLQMNAMTFTSNYQQPLANTQQIN